MKIVKNKILTVFLILIFTPLTALAVCDGCVVAAIQVAAQIVTGAISQSVTAQNNAGQSITNAVEKNTQQVEKSAEFQTQYDNSKYIVDKQAELRNKYRVNNNDIAPTACLNSQINTHINSFSLKEYDLGKNVLSGLSDGSPENNKIVNILTKETQEETTENVMSAIAHDTSYCSPDDVKNFGGKNSKICKKVGKRPNADKSINTLIAEGKDGVLNPKEKVDSFMYLKNAVPNIAREVKAGDLNSEQGKALLGKKVQYDAVISAAREPILNLIGNSYPIKENYDFLQRGDDRRGLIPYIREVGKNLIPQKIISKNFVRKVSVTAQSPHNLGYTSYINGSFGDDLQREMLLQQSQTNLLLLSLLERIEKMAVVDGLLLSTLKNMESKKDFAKTIDTNNKSN